MSRTGCASVLVISIVIFVSQTLAKPQSEHDRLEKIEAEDSSDSQTYSEYIEDGRQGSYLLNASLSSTKIISRSRRSALTTSECYYTISPGVGEVYRFHNVAATWTDARRICQREDGHLAVINSPDESRRIASLIDNDNPHIGSADSDYVLIGFHNYLLPRSNFGHRTIDGRTLEQAGFAEWATGEPNNLEIEDCGSVSRDGKLNDISCDKKYAFICELAAFNDVSPVGPAGPQGVPGIKGDAGIQGPVGVAGEKGEPGERGTDGLQGVAGEKGLKGDTGCVGSIGPKGNKGEKGEGPPGFPGPVGPRGPRGLRGSKGAAGSPGPTGSKGEKGNSGEKGSDGPRGVMGERGSKGDTGTPGPFGCSGEKGGRGSEGPRGLPGLVGPKGSRGHSGVQGIAGSPGPAGLNGRKGEQGEKGTDGLRGVKGDRGSQGAAGPPGPQGSTGSTGPTGDRGPLGPSGPRGEPGLGFDAVCLAVLASMEYSRGHGLIDRPEAPILSGNDTPQEKCREFIARAYEQMIAPAPLRYSVQPDGSKKSPAKTCKDLVIAYPDKPNGVYWIDPNGGDVADAISVICYVKNRRTCIRPSKTSREEPMSHIGDKREVWLSELENDTQITYTADADQMNALQLLSSHAEQGVIYHCFKSVGYYDAEGRTYDRGLKLLAWNDFELIPISNRDLEYEMISDGCRDRLDEWMKTKIIYRTGEPARLPIVDVGMRDVGKRDQRFIVEIGDVCFV